jgi:hypothetical protein
VLEQTESGHPSSIHEVLAADVAARERARNVIARQAPVRI